MGRESSIVRRMDGPLKAELQPAGGEGFAVPGNTSVNSVMPPRAAVPRQMFKADNRPD